jgi:hypothetical protein
MVKHYTLTLSRRTTGGLRDSGQHVGGVSGAEAVQQATAEAKREGHRERLLHCAAQQAAGPWQRCACRAAHALQQWLLQCARLVM